MEFAIGSLVRARGREWVVLPQSKEEVLFLRPLGGTDDEIAGICLALEKVEPAQFALPDIEKIGDYRSCRLLRDALRLGFRASAGPFRSFGHLAVEPRPYQLVPLLMALKLDPVRLLIADDTGVGKTVEAALVLRELLDRGEIERSAVLCPPHLAEQWQEELKSKFHIFAERVLPSTVKRLERNCRMDQSLFEIYPHVVVSIDFIKSDRRREEFLRACPELVIVDEAHTCAFEEGLGRGRHQRHELVKGLAKSATRHLILVTAVPHSGKEEAFRSLLRFLNPEFDGLPEDLTGAKNETHRRRLATCFIQRRRADIEHYLQKETPFPKRLEKEETYRLSPAYRKLFEKVLRHTRETIQESGTEKHRQRVRWWSALALLRSLSSSPAAAMATLRTRASNADTETMEAVDEIGRRAVLDLDDHDASESMDIAPGCDTEVAEESVHAKSPNRRKLEELARESESLRGEGDEKLKKAVKLLKSMVEEGDRPIVFCRFIPTAEYVAAELRKHLPKDVTIASITGELPPSEREERVLELSKAARRVLVCTDCLSEGINLQEYFDAVVHYDLSWNPTRHEQREGRVDRYGQPKKEVRVVTLYGADNPIDGIVLDVLLKKHKKIRSSLGICVPLPGNTDQVIEAVFEGILLKASPSVDKGEQMLLFDDLYEEERDELHKAWEIAADREKRSRTVFAQESLKGEEVYRELEAAQSSVGSGVDVAAFAREAFRAYHVVVSEKADRRFSFFLDESPISLREAIGESRSFDACFEWPASENALYLHRTHPIVEGLASYLLDMSLDQGEETSVAHRAGIIRTREVKIVTTILLLRLRYHILTQGHGKERCLLAEDSMLTAFSGSPQAPQWLPPEECEKLSLAGPDQNVTPEEARHHLKRMLDKFSLLAPSLEKLAHERGEELLDAHRRIRSSARAKGMSYRVQAKSPDILGLYVCLPIVPMG